MRLPMLLLALATLAAGIASAGHLVPGAWAGTGTVTVGVYDERDNSTYACPDHPITATFRVTGPTTGEIFFLLTPGDECGYLSWNWHELNGTPETGYLYERAEPCYAYERLELGPLGPATTFNYSVAWWQQYPSESGGLVFPACFPEPGYSACHCPEYTLDGVIDFR